MGKNRKPRKEPAKQKTRGKKLPKRPGHSVVKGPRCSHTDKLPPDVTGDFSEQFIKAAFEALECTPAINELVASVCCLGQAAATQSGDASEVTIRIGTVCSGAELLLTILPHIENQFYRFTVELASLSRICQFSIYR